MVASGVRRSWETAPDQGVAQPVDLLQQLRAQGLLPQLGPLQGQGGVVGEGAEQGPVRLGGRRSPHGQDAHRPAGGGQGHGAHLAGSARARSPG